MANLMKPEGFFSKTTRVAKQRSLPDSWPNEEQEHDIDGNLEDIQSAGCPASAEVYQQVVGLAVPVHAGATRPPQGARVLRTSWICEEIFEIAELSL